MVSPIKTGKQGTDFQSVDIYFCLLNYFTNMKTKIIVLFCIIIIHSTNVIAQFSYAGINIGYGAGWPAYALGTSTTITPSGTTYTLEKGSYGQGLNFGITGGYMFNKNVGVELGVSYLVGSKKEFTNS